uniref:Uncharacterized protein n=1 Tax=Avena sativa TaxID=4498 RepID=A0ACD5YJC1_AVESA
MEFSCLPPPAMMWGVDENRKYRIGEMPGDGQLCVASLEEDAMMLCVRGKGKGSDNGWVLERYTPMREVFDTVPGLPKHPLARRAKLWLSDIDAGRTGRLFVHTIGYGSFAYHMDTGKLDCLATEDGLAYGRPIFAYFSAPDGCSSS